MHFMLQYNRLIYPKMKNPKSNYRTIKYNTKIRKIRKSKLGFLHVKKNTRRN